MKSCIMVYVALFFLAKEDNENTLKWADDRKLGVCDFNLDSIRTDDCARRQQVFNMYMR